MTALGNVTLALRKVMGLAMHRPDIGFAALDRVGLKDKARAYPTNFPAASNSASPSPAPSRSNRDHAVRRADSALDPELVGSVLAVMRDLQASGMTWCVSHEMRFAARRRTRRVHGDGSYATRARRRRSSAPMRARGPRVFGGIGR